MDLGMPHEELQSRQGDARPHHIRSESVAEPMWVSGSDVAAQSMMAEQ
jgi:hypothetical protein